MASANAAKYPRITSSPLTASYGQMVHGDVPYLSHPELLPGDTDREIERLIRLGIIAAVYGHLDDAAAEFSRPNVRQLVRERTGIDPKLPLLPLSRRLARDAFRDRAAEKLKRLLARLGL